MELENQTWLEALLHWGIAEERGLGVAVLAKATYEIHGSPKQWSGNVCFQDSHVAYTNAFSPEGLKYTLGEDSIDDNLFTIVDALIVRRRESEDRKAESEA